MTFIYYWTIPLHSFITKNNRGCEPNLTELQHVSAIFNTLKKKSRALKDWIGWWSNCWIFGAWFLQSGTTSAFWWLERLDSKSWVNNQIYSTGLCVLLNYTRTFVSGVFFCWKHKDDSKHSIFLDHVHWVQKAHKSETLTWSMRVTIDGISVMVNLKRRGGA